MSKSLRKLYKNLSCSVGLFSCIHVACFPNIETETIRMRNFQWKTHNRSGRWKERGEKENFLDIFLSFIFIRFCYYNVHLLVSRVFPLRVRKIHRISFPFSSCDETKQFINFVQCVMCIQIHMCERWIHKGEMDYILHTPLIFP